MIEATLRSLKSSPDGAIKPQLLALEHRCSEFTSAFGGVERTSE